MAWINLVSTRLRRLSLLQQYEQAGEKPDKLSILEVVGDAAALLGDQDALRRVLEAGRPLRDKFLNRPLVPEVMSSVAALAATVELTCLYELIGESQREVWRQLRELASSKDPAARAMMAVLGQIERPQPETGKAKNVRYPGKAPEFVRDLGKKSLAASLAIASSPDHPLYATVFAPFVLPLALARAAQLGCAPLVTLSQGAWPERRGELLYFRQRERPSSDVKIRKDDPKTWFDFDALERKGDELYAFHYLGVRWKAPLLFDAELNAYRFLESLPHDWEAVRKHVPAETWAWIEQARAAGRCTHVVAYDPSEAGAPEESRANAAKHYGVRLVAKSLFDV